MLAAAAEAMYSQNSLTPALPENLAAQWNVLGYVTGLDALIVPHPWLLGVPAFQIGGRVFYGFVAQNIANPTQYVVVIRGTENVIEWLIDGYAQPMTPHASGFMVHAGFWNLYKSLEYGGQLAAAGISLAIPKGASIDVVGHSLGAVQATYLMTDVSLQRDGNVQGHIFASPKPGDKAFADYVDKVMPSRYNVYNYSRDLVPHAPLTLPMFDYHQLNNVTRITPASSARVAIKTDPACSHSATSYAALLGEPVQSNCLIGSSP